MSKVAALRLKWSTESSPSEDGPEPQRRGGSSSKQLTWKPPVYSFYSQPLMLADCHRHGRIALNQLRFNDKVLSNTKWEYVSDVPIMITVPPSTCSAVFLNDVIFASCSPNIGIHIWDIPTHKIFRTIEANNEKIQKIYALGESKLVAIDGNWRSRVIIYDWKTGEKLNVIRIPNIFDIITFGEKYIINTMLLSDYCVKMWDVSIERGEQFGCIREPRKDHVTCMQILPGAQLAIALSLSCVIKIFDMETLKSTSIIKLPNEHNMVSFINVMDRQTITFITDDLVIIANFKSGEIVKCLQTSQKLTSMVQISNNILSLFHNSTTSTEFSCIQLLHLEKQYIMKHFRSPPKDRLHCIRASFDGRTIVTVNLLRNCIGIYKLYSETNEVLAFFNNIMGHLEWDRFYDLSIVLSK